MIIMYLVDKIKFIQMPREKELLVEVMAII